MTALANSLLIELSLRLRGLVVQHVRIANDVLYEIVEALEFGFGLSFAAVVAHVGSSSSSGRRDESQLVLPRRDD